MKRSGYIKRVSEKRAATKDLRWNSTIKKRRPWLMCRTCHRAAGSSCTWKHPLLCAGICGQCGERRPLVECHAYDFRRRSGRIRPKKRTPSEFARIYGSRARAKWVKSLPCAACAVVGYSENAHTVNGGKSRKADHTTIIPLCGPRPDKAIDGVTDVWYIGCHRRFDRRLGVFADPEFRAQLTAEAENVARRWRESQGAA